ncbi:DUF4160 domain-containing protein [Candidatus Amarolinea dominans]|uniref:DUF4160 domain-containing protein n=1 Tax=Candidatus Amarolinea dominans TaxID=3140696 RepID=UPI0031CCC93E
MPEIARFYGIIITMYFGDPSRHPVPHFHARYGEYQASFAIDPPAWLAGIFAPPNAVSIGVGRNPPG